MITLVRFPAVGPRGLVRLRAERRRAGGPFPLFVWSHGLNADPHAFEPFLDAWASAGYVVVAPTLPGTSSSAVPRPEFGAYVDQPGQVSRVLDAILKDAATVGNRLHGLIDPTRIAAGGHSLGAVTTEALTQQSCCVDGRIAVAVEISYGTEPFPNSATLDRPIPTLFIHGDADTRFPVADSASAFSRAVGPRFLIVLHSGGHTPFSTWAGPVITNAVTDFLNLTLKRDPSARERLQIVGAVPSATFWAAS